MSALVVPALQGLGYSVMRSPMWSTIKQSAISGKDVAIGLWSYPMWEWTLTYNFMRQGLINGQNFTEFSQFAGFFNILNGGFDSFLYSDFSDNTVTGQGIGTGDGVTTAFQLVRNFGGFVEPMMAPNVVSAVYINGAKQSAANYTVAYWGATNSGVITFNSPPGNGLVITVDFSYYFPCRFVSDTLQFEQSMSTIYKLKSAKFQSIK